MDDTERVLERLARIERLRATAPPTALPAALLAALLGELRLLVPEAEAWARADGDARAAARVEKLRGEAEGMR